jgi:hypothetical protein
MAFARILPRTENIIGSNLTGISGATDRTYTLPYDSSVIVAERIRIIVQGASLHEGLGLDFTRSGNVITFKNMIDDDMVITIDYNIGVGDVSSVILTTGDLRYSNPLLLAEILGFKGDVPTWDIGTEPSKENVGTGDNTKTIFYLDQKNILPDTYTLYYGTAQDTITTLIEETHYSLDIETGKITLTTAGKTLLDTNNIYAVYSYLTNGMSPSYLIRVLGRAENEVDNSINATFTNGSVDNPNYPLEEEEQSSQGYFMDRIIINKKPLIDIKSSLSSNITDSVNTIPVKLGEGKSFPSSGYIIINNEVITYTGVSGDNLTGCSRGVLGTTASSHSQDDEIHTTILFFSDTPEGSDVVWTIQRWNTDMYANEDGLFCRYKDSNPSPLTKSGVAKRIKTIYYYGYNSIPEDITRLTLIYAKRMLMQDNIGKSTIAGRNEFQPEMFNTDGKEIMNIVNSYIILPMLNT